jgi:hypothetical protein
MHAYPHPEQNPRIRSPPLHPTVNHAGRVGPEPPQKPLCFWEREGVAMTTQDRLSVIQSYTWTLELLGEALVQHDNVLEGEQNPHLTLRNMAGIHQAMRIISRLAAEQCGKLVGNTGGGSTDQD